MNHSAPHQAKCVRVQREYKKETVVNLLPATSISVPYFQVQPLLQIRFLQWYTENVVECRPGGVRLDGSSLQSSNRSFLRIIWALG